MAVDAEASLLRPDAPVRRHLLDLDDYCRAEIEALLALTERMHEVLERTVQQVPALQGKTVLLAFWHDTPARVLFERAAHALSAHVLTLFESASVLNDQVPNALRTLHALHADVLVVRHAQAGVPHWLAQHSSAALLNAGDGWHAHPVQALLDMALMHQRFGYIEGLRVVLVGNVAQSGLARSHLWGLTTMGAQVTVCAPPTLVGPEPFWRATWPTVQFSWDLHEALAQADVVIVLSLQRATLPAGGLPSLREYRRFFMLTGEHLRQAGSAPLVLHADPVDEGVELASDMLTQDAAAQAGQARMALALRMALLYQLALPVQPPTDNEPPLPPMS